MNFSILLNFARYYATTKHGNQLYGGNLSYGKHLDDVEKQVNKWIDCIWNDIPFTVVPFDAQNKLLAIARLHDVLEDCGVKRKELEELFGEFVGGIVWLVTNAPGNNRKIRHALTYRKTRKHPLAVFIKLCDHIANIEQGGSLVGMYRKEHEDFERALRTKGQFDSMWKHLAKLLEV
jgi:(p)ppGpp synthase/HD superfamily hydrolase